MHCEKQIDAPNALLHVVPSGQAATSHVTVQ
jgi:hypothetical protein